MLALRPDVHEGRRMSTLRLGKASGARRTGDARMQDTIAATDGAVESPRVTVCIPTHNRAELLRACIDSVLAQTYRRFLIVVSDNASTDHTETVVRSFADPRIRYVRQSENIGVLRNYAQFLESVETEYALVLADDDLLYPMLLEQCVLALDESPEVGVVHSAFDVIGPTGQLLRRDVDWTRDLRRDTIEPADRFIERSMIWSCRIDQSTAVMRTSALPAGDYEDHADFGLWLRMAADGWSVAFLSRTLGAVRFHPQAHSTSLGAYEGTEYVKSDDTIAEMYAFKRRFIAGYAPTRARAVRLRRLAAKGYRMELILRARQRTIPERRPAATLGALWDAFKQEHRVALEPRAWRLLAASLLGRRIVDRLIGGHEAPALDPAGPS